jgi:hypothetical protein
MSGLKASDVHWVVNQYIGVSDGYLGDFTYRTHREFYPAFCDLAIDPDQLTGTTRDRFIRILESAEARTQASILKGIIKKYPKGSAVFRSNAAHEHMIALIATCSGAASIDIRDLRITSNLVQRALTDAVTLITSSGPTSAIDRVHTALHGYMKAACLSIGIEIPADASITELFKLLKQGHPRLAALGAHQDAIVKVMRALSSIMDAMNPVRNRGSLAHANEDLIDEHDAVLIINAARMILEYLDAKLAVPR